METRRRRDAGFTLIELLVVLLVLGVLVAVVVLAVGGLTDDGDRSACKSSVRAVEAAAALGFAQDGVYPADVDAMVTAGYLKKAPPDVQNLNYDGGTGQASCP